MQTQNSAVARLLTAVTLFGTIGIFVRYTDLPSGALAMLRGVIGMLFLLLLLALRRQKMDGKAILACLVPLIISGAALGFNWMLLFEAYHYTSVATATLCYYLGPVFVVIASALFFREKITLRRGLCVLAALLGMIPVSGVLGADFDLSQLMGVLYGIGAALLYAVVLLLNNHRLSHLNSYDKTVIQLLTSSITLLPYVILAEGGSFHPLTPTTVILTLVLGIVHTGIAYVCYFGAVGSIPAQRTALLSYLDPVIAVILSAILFREHLGFMGIIGAVLVLGSTLLDQLLSRKA